MDFSYIQSEEVSRTLLLTSIVTSKGMVERMMKDENPYTQSIN